MVNSKQTRQRGAESGRVPDRPGSSRSDVLAALPDMMFRMDGDGRYLEFMRAKDLEPFVPPEALLGQRMHDVLPERIADSGLMAVKAALKTREAQTVVYELPMGDGPHRYEARVVPLEIDEVLIIVRDLTESSLPASAGSAPDYALSKRELSVLASVALGITDKQIAYRLGISPDTVRKHVASVRREMGARSRTEASVRAVREGLLP